MDSFILFLSASIIYVGLTDIANAIKAKKEDRTV